MTSRRRQVLGCGVSLAAILQIAIRSSVGGPLDDHTPDVPTGAIEVRLEPLASGLSGVAGATTQFAPTDMTPLNDGTGRILVMTLGGVIRMIDGSGGLQASPFHDVTNSNTLIDPAHYGMTAIAAHPDFTDNGRFYTIETELPTAGAPDFGASPGGNHQDVIYEYTMNDAAADAFSGTKRELMRIRQNGRDHNANDLAFDANGLLYVPLGDGNNTNSSHNATNDNGQQLDNPYGVVMRIDPSGSNSDNGRYGVPQDNPFVGQADALDEIWSYGHRNPYRISFDRETGVLLAGEVGQRNVEEINVIVKQGNYGWNYKEGNFLFDTFDNLDTDSDGDLSDEDLDLSNIPDPRGSVGGPDGQENITPDPDNDQNGKSDFAETNGLIDPVFQYDHQSGRSVTGGTIFRPQAAITSPLIGKYVFADFQGGANNGGVARLFYGEVGDPVTGNMTGQMLEFLIDPTGESLPQRIYSIGEDEAGNLYILGGPADGSDGVILKIVPPALAFGDANNDGQVTGADLIAVQQNFGNLGPSDGALLGDANDDGQVTGADLISVQQNFGNVLAPASASVPEPTSITLLGLAGLLVSCRARH